MILLRLIVVVGEVPDFGIDGGAKGDYFCVGLEWRKVWV
jgi:hypothetical protein